MSARRPKEGSQLLKGYWFKLHPLTDNCRLQKVFVNFAPQEAYHPSLTPTYCPHRLEMAPCFVPSAFPLTLDDQLYFANELYLRRSTAVEKSYILEPKPRGKEYCMVCKMDYRDYRTHILHEQHKRAIRQSSFQKHILKLVRRVRKAERQTGEQSARAPNKRKPLSKGGSGRGGVK